MLSAAEAHRCGLVAQVFPNDQLVDEAVKVAEKIASFSSPVVQMAKAGQLFGIPVGKKEPRQGQGQGWGQGQG